MSACIGSCERGEDECPCPALCERLKPEEGDPPRGKRKLSDLFIVMAFEGWPLLVIAIGGTLAVLW